MRLWMRPAIAVAVVACVAAGTWYYVNQQRLGRQWTSYRVGSATSFEDARSEIARMENAPDHQEKIRDLVSKWGTGNQQFDFYLAWYAGHRNSSEALRETFSLEFGWREELLPRWACYWSWRAPQEPDKEMASLVEYLDVLAAADAPQEITWREALNLQAVFELTGQTRLARRLSPGNWRDRYRTWQKARQSGIPHVARPETPFPDWQGPVPDRRRLAEQ
jgi:hypothetical protein